MQFFFKAIGVTERLRRVCAPRVQNPVFDMLVRKSARRFSGLRNLNLIFMCVLALISAALLPYRVISFFIWFPIMAGYLFLPGALYSRTMIKSGFADQMLVTPISASAYVDALKRFFLLCSVFSAIPYVLYSIAWPPRMVLHYGTLPASNEMSRIVVSGLFYYCYFLSAVWLAYWALVVGGGLAVVGCLAAMSVSIWFCREPRQLMGLALWEPAPIRAVTIAWFWIVGLLISEQLKQRLVEMMSSRSEKSV